MAAGHNDSVASINAHVFARRCRRGMETPAMNSSLATILADGIYIGGGVILVILIVLVVLLLLRR